MNVIRHDDEDVQEITAFAAVVEDSVEK